MLRCNSSCPPRFLKTSALVVSSHSYLNGRSRRQLRLSPPMNIPHRDRPDTIESWIDRLSDRSSLALCIKRRSLNHRRAPRSRSPPNREHTGLFKHTGGTDRHCGFGLTNRRQANNHLKTSDSLVGRSRSMFRSAGEAFFPQGVHPYPSVDLYNHCSLRRTSQEVRDAMDVPFYTGSRIVQRPRLTEMCSQSEGNAKLHSPKNGPLDFLKSSRTCAHPMRRLYPWGAVYFGP